MHFQHYFELHAVSLMAVLMCDERFIRMGCYINHHRLATQPAIVAAILARSVEFTYYLGPAVLEAAAGGAGPY